MRCDEARRAIFDLGGGEAPTGELAAHLAGCRHCREEYESDRAFQAAVLSAPWPSPRSALDGGAARYGTGRGGARTVTGRTAFRLAAAMAIVTLGAGLAYAAIRGGALRIGGEDAFATAGRPGDEGFGEPCGGLLGWLFPDRACGQAGWPDPLVWSRLAPIGEPPPPRGHGSDRALGYDESGNRLVLFGGSTVGDTLLNDTWVLSGADGTEGRPSWRRLDEDSPPSPRRDHAGAYDPVGNRLIVYGGCLGQCLPLDDRVYVLSHANGQGGPAAWTRLEIAGEQPPARNGHTAVYSPASNRLIVFGGDDCCGHVFADTWVLTHANGLGGRPRWLRVATVGASPPGRAHHAAAYDAAGDRMIVVGGQAGGVGLTDVWVLNHATAAHGTPAWTQLSPDRIPRFGTEQPAVVYQPQHNRLLAIGGDLLPQTLSEVWSLENANGRGGRPAWLERGPGGAAPSGRCCALAFHRPATGVTVIVAGEDAAGRMNEVWTLGPAPRRP